MTRPASTSEPEICNCLPVRQAARHVAQFYDRLLAPGGSRTVVGRPDA